MDYTFNEIRSLGDAHKQHMYKLIIAPLPGSGDVDERVLSMRNVSCQLPDNGNETINYAMGGFQLHEAGLTKQGGIFSASFVESMNVGVRKRMDSWLELCNQRLTNIQMPKSVYQTTCEVQLHDGQKVVQYVGKFHGFFITNIKSISLENRSNGITKCDCDFSYDLWVPA